MSPERRTDQRDERSAQEAPRASMFERALTIGSVRDVDIRVHLSWLFIAALITWNFWARFTGLYDFDSTVAVVMALSAAVLFFSSILVHELAHALEAVRRGVEVGGITLFLFGGATESKFDVRRPRDEFALTAVGPFSSFLLAALFGATNAAASSTGMDEVAHVLGALGWLNLALGIFNLLPGAPLDGGRILRSVVWWITHDRRRAIRVAANTGRVLGLLLIGLGAARFLFVPGAAVGGIWLVFIGWFLRQSATLELAQAEASEVLGQVPVRRLLPPTPETVSADEPLSAVVDQVFAYRIDDVLPVRAEHGDDVVGVLSVDQIRDVPRSERDSVRVQEAMTPAEELPSVDAGAEAVELLDFLDPHDRAVLVSDAGRPVGIIGSQHLRAAVRRHAELVDD